MYLQCCNATHAPITLPDGVPIMVGRSVETKIADKMCSRNQLQIQANYNKKYLMVKQLGANPSQIDGIDIGQGKTNKLLVGQILHVANMKYPHKLSVCLPNQDTDNENSKKSSASNKQTSKLNNGKDTPVTDKHKGADDCQNSKSVAKPSTSTSKSSHWSQGLKSSMEDKEMQVYSDEKVVVIKDKYPKAKCHWLVMPHENIISITHLRTSHLPLLKHMLEVGKDVAKKHAKEAEYSKISFRYGYHAVPSMSHLHMHVISQDFDSPSLKTKKHWNSFTTDYFVDADEIIGDIEAQGKVKNRRHMTELLKESLRCHICKKGLKNMPELKKHVQTCGSRS